MQRTLFDYVEESGYCPECGRKLIDYIHCPVHGVIDNPVDENAPVVKEFKELEGTGD